MSVILIILGLAICSYQTSVHSFIGWTLIIIGILRALFKKKAPPPPPPPPPPHGNGHGDSEPYTGRTHGDTYCGVYTRDGKYYHETELTETIDGRFITPDGDVVDRDSDEEYRSY